MENKSTYLGSQFMRATASSLALVSTVLGFEITELWTEGDPGAFYCTYMHASDHLLADFPDIITGYYPEHKAEHKRSPKVIIGFTFVLIYVCWQLAIRQCRNDNKLLNY